MSESNANIWMIYGAYGVTGRLIAEEAVRRGHRPLLAGRDPGKLAIVAGKLGLPSVVVSLEQPEPLRAALRRVRLVIHTAGPFARTGQPMLEACLDTHTPYVDVNGEAGYGRTIEAFGPRAAAAAIPLLTAAGFGATYGDCLARHMVDRLPDATHLRLSVAAENAYSTPAVRRTILSVIAEGGACIEAGHWRKCALAHETWTVQQDGAAIAFAAAPMPELLAASISTAVPNIVVGRPMSAAAARFARTLTPVLRGVLGIPALRRRLEGGNDAGEAAPDNSRSHRSRIWAEAVNGRGQRSLAMLETNEGYAAAALAAVVNAEALLDGQLTGALTPGRAFGAAHLVKFPDTRLTDLKSEGVSTIRNLSMVPVAVS